MSVWHDAVTAVGGQCRHLFLQRQPARLAANQEIASGFHIHISKSVHPTDLTMAVGALAGR
jgi:hypothetical protein